MAIINDSVRNTEQLLEVHNSGVRKFSVSGNGELADSRGFARVILNPVAKNIVDGSPTTLFTVPVAPSSGVGGIIHFQVYAADATDFQMITGIATYSSVNKAGTLTNAITYATANEAKVLSSGTLTLAFTMAEDTPDVVFIKVQPTGSLTETTYNITYTVFPLRGVVTIV
jgi:hypothetical protein